MADPVVAAEPRRASAGCDSRFGSWRLVRPHPVSRRSQSVSRNIHYFSISYLWIAARISSAVAGKLGHEDRHKDTESVQQIALALSVGDLGSPSVVPDTENGRSNPNFR